MQAGNPNSHPLVFLILGLQKIFYSLVVVVLIGAGSSLAALERLDNKRASREQMNIIIRSKYGANLIS